MKFVLQRLARPVRNVLADNKIRRKDSCDQNLLNIHLSLLNKSGSVEHYYHFLLGFFIPLVLAHDRRLNSKGHFKIYIRSCAIMDSHVTTNLPPDVIIIDKKAHEVIAFKSYAARQKMKNLVFDRIEGYDHPDSYDFDDFSRAKRILKKQLSSKIEAAKVEFDKSRLVQSCPLKIVLIYRQPPDPFYTLGSAEIKGAGSSRRSIQNFEQLSESLSTHFDYVIVTALENTSLAYQIALFEHADVIVGQHGAALANTIWCRPNTKLVEIYPCDLPTKIHEGMYFKKLAEKMQMDYCAVNQEGRHSSVSISDVISAIDR